MQFTSSLHRIVQGRENRTCRTCAPRAGTEDERASEQGAGQCYRGAEQLVVADSRQAADAGLDDWQFSAIGTENV